MWSRPHSAGDEPEQEVLQQLVLGEIGVRAVDPARVDPRRLVAAGIREVEAAQIGDLELLGHRAVGVLALEDRRDHLAQVRVERRGRGLELDRLEVDRAQLVSSGKNSARSGLAAASPELSSGNTSASMYGTQRNRGGATPGPIATRLPSIVAMCA